MKPSSEFEDDSMLARINQRHAVIGNFGGKCVVWDGWKRNFQSTGDFVKRYRHIRVPVGVDKHGKEVTREAGEWWLAQQDRRYFDDVVFDPAGEADLGLSLNL